MTWESNIRIGGKPPARRYGHSMVSLDEPDGYCDYAKAAVFGGISGAPWTEMDAACLDEPRLLSEMHSVSCALYVNELYGLVFED